MRRSSYFKRASKRFLEGTRFKAPVDAVEAGVRSLELWARLLEEEREVEAEYQQVRRERLMPRERARSLALGN